MRRPPDQDSFNNKIKTKKRNDMKSSRFFNS